VIAEAERYTSFFFDVSTTRQSADLRGIHQSAPWRDVVDFREAIVAEVAFTVNIFGDGTAVNEPLQLTPRLVERATGVDGASALSWIALTDAQLDALRAEAAELIDG